MFNTLRFYAASQFSALGTPFAITALEKRDDQNRRMEFHLMLFRSGTSPVHKARRYGYYPIPSSVISDEAIYEDGLRIAQAELDAIVLEERQKSGPDTIPYGFRYDLRTCPPGVILLALIRCKALDQVRAIRDSTHSQELQSFLPTFEAMRDWSISETNIG